MIDARELARRLETSQFAAPCTSAEMAFISKVLRQHAEATDIQGDAEVLKYVTSGNDVPVTRCTVSADLIRQLVRERGEAAREWTSVGDGLPGYEYEGDVLTVGIMTGEVSMRSGRYVTALANEAKNTGEECAITHWMPAPKPPLRATSTQEGK